MRYTLGWIALLTIPLCLWLAGCAGNHSVRTGDVSQRPPETAEMRKGFAIPDSWTRRGLERLKKYCNHSEPGILTFGEALAKEHV
jgi:hypothetical protein